MNTITKILNFDYIHAIYMFTLTLYFVAGVALIVMPIYDFTTFERLITGFPMGVMCLVGWFVMKTCNRYM